jgi:hypothetical protein
MNCGLSWCAGEFLFKNAHTSQGGPLSDEAIGGILLVLSLALLCICLLLIVKLLNSLMKVGVSIIL